MIDTGEGVVASRFKHGKAIESEERSDSIAAFEEASAAAKEVREMLKSAGNAASAKFYMTKAGEPEVLSARLQDAVPASVTIGTSSTLGRSNPF